MAVLPHFTELDPSTAGTSCERAQPGRTRAAGTLSGFTLIEMLMTIAVLAILAAVLIPQISSDIPERLEAAAQVVAADFDYARALAVGNNSLYRITFDVANNRYVLRHSGAQTALNALPRSPFRESSDAADQQTTDLAQLPLPKPAVRLSAVVRMQSGGQSTTDLEFNALGGTTAAQETVVWLSCGAGGQRRYISVHVNPLTGLSEIGPLAAGLPAAVATIAATSQAAEATQATKMEVN